MENRKKLMIRLSAILMGALLLLTFFSNTIHNLDVAGVVVGFETGGIITTTHRSHGILTIRETHTLLYADYAGRAHFFVKDGDSVHEDEPLFEIHVDRSHILDRIVHLRHQNSALPWANQAENNREIERLQGLLATGDLISHTEYAPAGGVVRFLPDMGDDNTQVTAGQEILRLGMRQGTDFVLVAYFPESLLAVPDIGHRQHVRLNIPALNAESIPVDIERITAVEGRLRLEFSVDVPDANGGERTEIVIEDIITPVGRMLPNYAIHEDERGEFILIARRESNTLLGYSYFAERVGITVTQRGDRSTSFNLSGEMNGPIILQSDRYITDGDRVRMVGER